MCVNLWLYCFLSCRLLLPFGSCTCLLLFAVCCLLYAVLLS